MPQPRRQTVATSNREPVEQLSANLDARDNSGKREFCEVVVRRQFLVGAAPVERWSLSTSASG